MEFLCKTKGLRNPQEVMSESLRMEIRRDKQMGGSKKVIIKKTSDEQKNDNSLDINDVEYDDSNDNASIQNSNESDMVTDGIDFSDEVTTDPPSIVS